MELRAESELLLGKRFDKQAFHDFIPAQGLLPPARHGRKSAWDLRAQRGHTDQSLSWTCEDMT